MLFSVLYRISSKYLLWWEKALLWYGSFTRWKPRYASSYILETKKQFLMAVWVLAMTIFSGLIPKEQAKPRNSQSFHERGLTGYFKRCCLRARLLIYQASKAVIFASPGKVEDTSHTSFQPVPIIKPNYQELCRRSLYTHLGPKYYSSHLKAPGSLGPNSQQDLCSCIS